MKSFTTLGLDWIKREKDNDNWIITVINNFEIFRFLGIINIIRNRR